VNWLALGLFACAVAILVAAEWPRLVARVGFDRRADRRSRGQRRQLRRAHLTLVEDESVEELDDDREAFAASVARDLERLPTIDDND
jgi:hypothetical protein